MSKLLLINNKRKIKNKVINSHLNSKIDEVIKEKFNQIFSLTGNAIHKNNPSNKFREDLFNYLYDNHNGKNMLELGTFNGGTTAVMALICKEKGGHVFSIDYKNHKLEIAKNIINKLGLDEYITFLEIDLYNDDYIDQLEDKDISVCFIDAKHTYDSIKMDATNCKKLEIDKIVFHDYGLNSKDGPNLSVKKVINELDLDIIKLIGEKPNSSIWKTTYGNHDIEGAITSFK